MRKYYKKLIGERVYLSPMRVEDASKYAEWMSDFAVSDGIGNACQLMSLDAEREWVLNEIAAGSYQFAIVRKEDDLLLGNCGLFKINTVHRSCTTGLFIGDAENRHMGYGAEVLRLLLDYAFNYLNLNSVILTVFDFNSDAIACYKKVGFVEFGRERQAYFCHGVYNDRVYMQVLSEDWRAPRA